MKTIANFGEWVIRHWFPLGAIVLLIVMAIVGSCYGVKTVTLDEKHWECTLPIAVGLMTDCREYTYKSK